MFFDRRWSNDPKGVRILVPMADKMDCNKFQDTISDYLEGAVDSRVRAECAAHRLICRECRELYNDVRATVNALSGAAFAEKGPEGLENRIIAATTTGEMLSCTEFDRLLERYFDGVILAPTFQNFQSHFGKCPQCRRLLAGIEDAISMCRDAKEVELAVPEALHGRIVAATVGSKPAGLIENTINLLLNGIHLLWTPQIAAAALIFAASSLFISSRFGSVSGMAEYAESKAKRIVTESEKRVNDTGERARSGLRNVSVGMQAVFFRDGESTPKKSGAGQRAEKPLPSPQRSAGEADAAEEKDGH